MCDAYPCRGTYVDLADGQTAENPEVVETMQVGDGIRFGLDMMLASIDGDELSPHGVPFAYIKQDEAGITKKAIELLVGRIDGEPIAKEDYLVHALFHAGSVIME